MTVCDPIKPTKPGRERKPGRRGSPSTATSPTASTCSPADLAEADRLISDLAALLDAGLIAIQQRVLGPARYGVASDMG